VSDRTAIEWADASWNPVRVGPHRWYCEKISPGCDNCYASTFNRRMGGETYPTFHDVRIGDGSTSLPSLDERVLDQVSSWRKPRRIFVCSMTDLFGEWVPFEVIDRIFCKMWAASHHQYLVLTKRPRRMLYFLAYRSDRLADTPGSLGIPSWPQNVWAGVTIESDRYVWRADLLRAVPAAVRWISAEPLLGPLDSLSLRGIQWLVVGGESGPGARRMDPEWARSLVSRCEAAGVPIFVKQL
jgi:protein gp37